MIPKECKRLAEVDFPIAVVSKHAAREKSIRHGHPSTLHLWWARRPLASCRAMLLALLLPDPCDPNCPEEFKRSVRRMLPGVQGQVGPADADLRQALLKFIGDFADWDRSANPKYLEVSRGLVKAAHGEEPPLVVDPFAGGGSIPLEALRLGCDTFASDLNPVACLILKVMLEDIPRHGPGLADELRAAGEKIKAAAEKELAEFYPADPDGARPIAYLWARTVRCEAPNCGAEIPLVRSFWLCKKEKRKRALRWTVVRSKDQLPWVDLEVFEPITEADIPKGTVSRAKATCLACGTVLAPDRVCAQLAAQRGGADVIFDGAGRRTGGARLLAVVTLSDETSGRQYRVGQARDYEAIRKAMRRLEKVAAEPLPGGVSAVPDEPLPPTGTLGFRVQRYGMLRWGDLFAARQKVALCTLRAHASRVSQEALLLAEVLAQTQSHVLERNSALSRWRPQPYMETVEGIFGRQALPIVWDFAEAVPLSSSTGSFEHSHGVVVNCVAGAAPFRQTGAQVEAADATNHPLPDAGAQVWFSDPPYYDAVPYSDLSDFFFVWLKRALPGHPLLRDPFDPQNPLTPKTREAVQDETKRCDGRPKDRAFFEETMARAFAEGRRVLRDDGVGSVVFAHKTTEGWEALLSGLIRGGWTITGSWPIATEMATRLRARESAALATSVHLVCRPRPEDAPVGDWGAILRELPRSVGDWMERLQTEGVRGADLVFACIGPALELFSRHPRVETPEGREIGLPEFLEKVWEVVGRTALSEILGTAEARARNGAAGAVEEDARLTALFLWTLRSTVVEEVDSPEEVQEEESEAEEDVAPPPMAGFTLVYDVVRRFAQPLGIHLPDWEGRLIQTSKGVVRLLSLEERAVVLFGDEGTDTTAHRLEEGAATAGQQWLFPEFRAAPKIRAGRRKVRVGLSDEALAARKEATTLDRVHAAMVLQSSGRTNALRALVEAEVVRGPYFVRLANALSALYPSGCEEKRLLDAMLLAVPK